MRKKVWTKSKAKKPRKTDEFVGSYGTYRGNRLFVLENSAGKQHEFESHEAAKKLGWKAS